MAYSGQVLDHYENPRNVGKLDKNDPSVGTGLVGAPACGDVLQMLTPCINVCQLDENKICIGCFRSLQEISLWTQYSDTTRKNIIERVHDRINRNSSQKSPTAIIKTR